MVNGDAVDTTSAVADAAAMSLLIMIVLSVAGWFPTQVRLGVI